jgi:uncharacterized protein YbjT (DUF2867 family)
VKGEAEEAVKEGGPAVVSIFRPAMIIGSPHTPWLLEKLLPVFSFVTPTNFKSITVEQIAKAMVSAALNAPANSAVYHYAEMTVLKFA